MACPLVSRGILQCPSYFNRRRRRLLFFFQAEDCIRDLIVTGVQTCALPISTLQGGKPFNRPTHVALCPKNGDVYISDGYGNSRVHKYDPKGRHLLSWGEPGTDPGCFNLPHNIATDAEGQVYVADPENHRVQVFDGKGKYLTQINNLHRPCGLFAERHSGLLYVGELPTQLAVNAEVAHLGARVSIVRLDGERVGRVGGRFAGEKPGEF